jgi:hypothetical protein
MAWFNKSGREFQALVKPFAGKPITYVEVGVWKGDSAAWMCENVLTHPDAIGYGFDPYPTDPKHGQAEIDQIKLEVSQRLSKYVTPGRLPRFVLNFYAATDPRNGLPDESLEIDLLYLDGDHTAGAVVCDWCAAWPLLKVGTVVIFDDWGIGKRKHHRHVPEAFEAIKLAFHDMVDVIHEGPLQAAVRVRAKEPPLEPKMERLAAIRARGEARAAKKESAAQKAMG